MTLQEEEKMIRSIGRLEGQIDYLNEVNRLWGMGLLSTDELLLRLTVLEEQQDVCNLKAQEEEVMDRGSEADQTAGYLEVTD